MNHQPPIFLYFHNLAIAEAFSNLLVSLGFQTVTTSSHDDLIGAEKIVTEPLYFQRLSVEQQDRCLVISGQNWPNERNVPQIAQPLTPNKIQEGLGSFLKN